MTLNGYDGDVIRIRVLNIEYDRAISVVVGMVGVNGCLPVAEQRVTRKKCQ